MKKKPEALTEKAVYGLIGCPVKRSLSPDIFNFAFSRLNLKAEYRLWEVGENELSGAVEKLRRLPVNGFSVTIPYKTSIIGHLDCMDDRAITIGAVNCVLNQNNILTGYNTDYAGVIHSLEPFRDVLQAIPVLVTGAGGAARAAVYALLTTFRTGPVFIANRTKEHAEKLLADFKFSDSENRLKLFPQDKWKNDKDVFMINCLPCDVFLRFLPENPCVLSSVKWLFDLNYLTPIKSIENLFQAKINYTDGLKMLIKQASEALMIWTGKTMPEQKILCHLRSEKLLYDVKT